MLRRLFESKRGPQGPLWTEMSKSFHNRTPASLRNHWRRMEQGKTDVAEGNFKNYCTACGQPKRVGHTCVVLQVRTPAHGSPAGTGFSAVDRAEPPRARCAAG